MNTRFRSALPAPTVAAAVSTFSAGADAQAMVGGPPRDTNKGIVAHEVNSEGGPTVMVAMKPRH